MKYTDIQIQPLRNNRYKILKDIKYKDIIVPKGYMTNGANIPRIFWSIFPPNKSDYMPAVIIHDYLTDMKEYQKADQYFKDIMREIRINKTIITIFYYGVRIYHKLKYNK